MNLELLALVIAVIIHIVVFNRSSNINKKKRLVVSLSMIAASIVLFIPGLMIGLGGNYGMKTIAIILLYAPVYIPLLSLSVYLPIFSKKS